MVIAHPLGILFLSAVVLFFSRCAVQHPSIFMWFYGQYWAFRQFTRLCGCVPKLNWFKNVKNNFCGPTNQSIGPNFPRGQHATVAGWREHDGNFDTVQTTLILVHWKLTTKLNVESYFWTWDFHLQYTCNILQSPMEPENIRFESIWSIIITITIIITIITITLRIIPNKIPGTGGDLFCGPSHHHCHCHPSGVPCLGALGFEVHHLDLPGTPPKNRKDTSEISAYSQHATVIFGIHLHSDMDECCAHIFSAVFGWDDCRKWHTRKDKMWLAALNMPGFSYQTDEMIFPIDFHILGPRVAQNLVSCHLILLGCIQLCRPLFHLQ